ncbi:sel1 repeat family protein [Stutzerimonas nosocomialis]|uniref:tetratricopeptide repeat protein n=1 Tax=Stutzerimonas nosocomialis TaxID=1056496 RepID=UPI001108ADB1|nr:sel1 repeat family protein [Stutzerimonas nosocomialis]
MHLLREEVVSDEQMLSELQRNPRHAARLILDAAAEGDLDAQALLGQILLDGRGIAQDAALALQWFLIAAHRGHAMASNMAGRCLELGWGCEPDPAAAARHYRHAARRELDWGLYNLANLLATGRGVPMDQALAFRLYHRAAELGHAKSMNLVGRYLEDGRVVPADPQAGHQWYRRSAEAGDFRGQFSYAAVLIAQGDWERARHWLLQALQGGHLKFLRKARDELLAAALPEIDDIALAYSRRCNELIGQATSPV